MAFCNCISAWQVLSWHGMLCVQEILYNCAWQDRWVQERHSTPDMHLTGVLMMLSEASAGAGRKRRVDEAPVG